jgi:hypothetical protein
MAILAARRSQHPVNLKESRARGIGILLGCASRQRHSNQRRRQSKAKNYECVLERWMGFPRISFFIGRESVHG